MSRPKKVPIEGPLLQTLKKFSRKVSKLAKVSGFTEQQVLEDLMVHGSAETEELYGEINEWRNPHAEPEAHDLEPIKAESQSNGSGADVFDTFPDPPEPAVEQTGAEAALDGLGDPELGRGLRPEDEAPAVVGNEPSTEDGELFRP